MTMTANPRIGSSFESFLEKEGILEDCTAAAVKRVLARQIERAMRERSPTKSAMAKPMRTSHRALDRLLDLDNPSVTPGTLQRAVAIVRRKLRLKLVGGAAATCLCQPSSSVPNIVNIGHHARQ
jgi:antitoxin HicB